MFDAVVLCGVIAALCENCDADDLPFELTESGDGVHTYVCDPRLAGVASRTATDGAWAEFAAVDLAHQILNTLGVGWVSEAERLADQAVSARSSHVGAALALLTVGPVRFSSAVPVEVVLPGGQLTADVVARLVA